MHVTLCAAMPIHSLQLLPLCDDLRFQKYLSSLHISVGESAYDDVCAFVCVCVCMRVKPVVMQPCSLMSGLWHLTYYDACSVCPMGLGLLSASMEACPRLHTSHWISSHHKTSHHVTFTLSHSHNHFSFVFPHYLHCFHLSENSQTSFLYSFSFALMCLTHLLFSSSFFAHSITSSHPFFCFVSHFLSFSVYHPVYYTLSLFLSLLLSAVSTHTRPISFYQPTPVGSIIPSW